MNGKKQLLKLRIDPAAVVGLSGDQPDVEMLEDLVVAAVNEAGRKADEAFQSSVQGMLGRAEAAGAWVGTDGGLGINLPGPQRRGTGAHSVWGEYGLPGPKARDQGHPHVWGEIVVSQVSNSRPGAPIFLD